MGSVLFGSGARSRASMLAFSLGVKQRGVVDNLRPLAPASAQFQILVGADEGELCHVHSIN